MQQLPLTHCFKSAAKRALPILLFVGLRPAGCFSNTFRVGKKCHGLFRNEMRPHRPIWTQKWTTLQNLTELEDLPLQRKTFARPRLKIVDPKLAPAFDISAPTKPKMSSFSLSCCTLASATVHGNGNKPLRGSTAGIYPKAPSSWLETMPPCCLSMSKAWHHFKNSRVNHRVCEMTKRNEQKQVKGAFTR